MYYLIELNMDYENLKEFININNAGVLIDGVCVLLDIWRLDFFIKHNNGHALSVNLKNYTDEQKRKIINYVIKNYWIFQTQKERR